MLPPHNVIVEDRPDLGHGFLAMMPGEEFDVAFPEQIILTGADLTASRYDWDPYTSNEVHTQLHENLS